jgi:hypothetical protein
LVQKKVRGRAESADLIPKPVAHICKERKRLRGGGEREKEGERLERERERKKVRARGSY